MGVTHQVSESATSIIRDVSGAVQFIGILLSLFRLWFRLRIRRLWWEDAWAFIACICSIVLLAAKWIYLEGDWTVSVIGFWVYTLVLTCVVWAVRMSILFSVARIIHPTERMRRIVMGLAILISLISLAFMAMKLWWYCHDLSWVKHTGFYTRPANWLPHSMYIYELSNCVADAILIYLPLRFLWTINLPRKQRRMIIAIFVASIIVTMTSIFRAVTQMLHLVSLVGVATDFEAACSTINCNLLVIVTLIYRLSRTSVSSSDVSESEEDDYTTPVGTRDTTRTLTTINLSALYSSEESSQPCTSTSTSEARREHSSLSH